MTAVPDTPTAAIAVEPSLPTQIMSTVGPSMFTRLPIIIGHDRVKRLRRILPVTQLFPGVYLCLRAVFDCMRQYRYFPAVVNQYE